MSVTDSKFYKQNLHIYLNDQLIPSSFYNIANYFITNNESTISRFDQHELKLNNYKLKIKNIKEYPNLGYVECHIDMDHPETHTIITKFLKLEDKLKYFNKEDKENKELNVDEIDQVEVDIIFEPHKIIKSKHKITREMLFYVLNGKINNIYVNSSWYVFRRMGINFEDENRYTIFVSY